MTANYKNFTFLIVKINITDNFVLRALKSLIILLVPITFIEIDGIEDVMVVLLLSSEPDCPSRLGHLRHPVIFLEPHLTGALWVHGIGARPRLEAHQHVR